MTAEGREPETARPAITYWDAEARYKGTLAAIERFRELDHRHHMVRAEETLKARGEYDPARFGPQGKYQPLTVADRLELVAAGEMLARYFRHPVHVDCAVTAGATWDQIAAAAGSDEASVRHVYREWADGQHELWLRCEGTFGMDAAEHAEALRKAAEPGAEAGQ